MKPKQKDNPLLLTGQDSNLKVTEKNVVPASIYDSTEELNITYDHAQKNKVIIISYGRLMSPSRSIKISPRDFIDKFQLGDKDLPF